jgi:hypothetical protein
VSRFDDTAAFLAWVDSFDIDVGHRIDLAQRIADGVYGVGFALACDFLKEMGCLNYAKPDVHLRELFQGLRLVQKSATDQHVFRAITRVAEHQGVTPYAVDCFCQSKREPFDDQKGNHFG